MVNEFWLIPEIMILDGCVIMFNRLQKSSLIKLDCEPESNSALAR